MEKKEKIIKISFASKIKSLFIFKIPRKFKSILREFTAFKYFRNFLFCKKYPFMKVHNVWTGEFMGYRFTWYDDIPRGWAEAFGEDLIKELKQAIKEDKKVNRKCKFTWEQIKSKYGSLRLYCSGGKNALRVTQKYELLSIGYCENCGKPARYVTKGWIEYLCPDCFKNIHVSKIQETGEKLRYKRQCRLKKKDIPQISSYVNNEYKPLDLEKEYGIDFYQLWAIKK